MKLVVIESPLAGNMERNKAYAQLCMLDCLMHGEAPYASHLLYTQCLDDTVPAERLLGMPAGFAWGDAAALRAVYIDLGISDGMRKGIALAKARDQAIDHRNLDDTALEKFRKEWPSDE